MSTALKANLWNAVFFVCCSLLGLFFITALLIEAFSQSYYDNKKEQHMASSRREWYTLVMVMEIWVRHSHSTCALFDGEQRRECGPVYNHFTEQGMPFTGFLELMAIQRLATARNGWMDVLQSFFSEVEASYSCSINNSQVAAGGVNTQHMVGRANLPGCLKPC